MDPLLQSLVQICSVPGNELELRDLLIQQLKPFGKIHKTNWTDFYCTLGNAPKNTPSVVITAHMDSPGFIVQEINDDGSIQLIALGGLNPTHLHLRPIRLKTEKKSYPGLLLKEGENNGIHTRYKGIFGFQSRQEAAKKGVKKGDSACFDNPYLQLLHHYILSPHLDNRLGCYLLLRLAKQLANHSLPFQLHLAATSCEEMGGRGAKIIAQQLQPTVAICLDATYEEGSVKMGNGPVITLSDHSVLLHPKIRSQLEKIAQKKKIPLQFEVYNYAGTDAGAFKDAGNGCITICPLIATRFNHSPYEMMNLKDFDYTEKFVLALLKHLSTTGGYLNF
ncbi:MAG: M28 family peptidase [Planctomycetota bacterium]|nr:MAG: M28 family peptidase [Planctomycetota bacterium]